MRNMKSTCTQQPTTLFYPEENMALSFNCTHAQEKKEKVSDADKVHVICFEVQEDETENIAAVATQIDKIQYIPLNMICVFALSDLKHNDNRLINLKKQLKENFGLENFIISETDIKDIR